MSITPLSFLHSFSFFKTKVLFLLFIFLFLITPSSFCLENINNSDKEITGFRIKIRRIQKGIDSQKDDILKAKNQERNLLIELEILDRELAEQQVKLDEFKEQIAHQHTLIENQTSKLNTIRSEKAIASNHLGKRIRAFYTMDDIGLLNATFSTKTFSELLQFHDAFGEMIQYDQNLIAAFHSTINNLVRARTALSLEESVLQDFMEQAAKEKKGIIQTTNEKKELLTHIKTQAKLNKQAIIEMQQVSDALSNALVTLKNETSDREYRFADNKGSLPPPVDGTIVTLFQQKHTNRLGISRKSSGITLEAADGTKIKAISEGEVIFSGYLRGYGNTVIIHHGYQYYSITSRIEKLIVQKGDTVKAQSVIGIMGDAATLFDGGIYLEIRHGKKPLDPLLWLNPNRLSTREERTNIQHRTSNTE